MQESSIIDVWMGSKNASGRYFHNFGKFPVKHQSLSSFSVKCQAEACWMTASEMKSHDAESSHSVSDITYVQNLKGKDNSLFNTHFVI